MARPWKIVVFVLVASLLAPPRLAHAWFFFFIPGKAIEKMKDKVSGDDGDSCVSSKAKVGDLITSGSGNTATVVSLFGTSGRCKDPALPIRSRLDFHFLFASQAGIELPNSYKQKDIADTERFNGVLLKAEDSNRDVGVVVSARKQSPGTDLTSIARAIGNRMTGVLDEASTSDEEELTINGLAGARFQVTGKAMVMFHPKFEYLVTLLSGRDEVVVVTAYSKADAFESKKAELAALSTHVTGISGDAGDAVQETKVESQPSGAANKLRDLDKLFKEGVITEPEYAAKKKLLLEQL